jgi:hypothetical protein
MSLLRRVLTLAALTSLILIALALLFGRHNPPKQSHYGADVTVHATPIAAPDTIKTTEVAPVATAPQIQMNDKKTCDQSVDVYCYGVYGVDEYGTPIPKVKETQPAEPWIRSDGNFNYCYKMNDGSWTTVIGQLAIQPGVYYYGGSIDQATQAPAYADQSQAWCAAHVPAAN